MNAAVRSLDELVDREDPGMAFVQELASESERTVDVLPIEAGRPEHTLLALQVTTRSPLGAIAYETGGIVLDHGWLRILGSGCARLPRSIDQWNALHEQRGAHRLPGALLVADDALGGFFAINGGAFDGQAGNVFYLAPDTCEWEDLELGHSGWLSWAMTGDVPRFYESMRWPGWEAEVSELTGDQCLSVIPFLWTDGEPIENRARNSIPIEEAWGLHAIEFPRLFGEADN